MRISSVPLIPALLLSVLLGGCDKRGGDSEQVAAANAAAAAEGPPATSLPAPPASSPAPAAKGKPDTGQAGSAMPADAFADPAGKPVTLAAFKGKPVLVNLWATWCGPCVKEMPALDRLAARTKGKLQVLVVNQDSKRQADDPVPAWWAKAALANLRLYRDAENNLGFAYGGGQLPTTVLYDAQGREVWRIAGEADWDKADAMLGI